MADAEKFEMVKNDLRQISDYAQQNGLVYENAGGNVIVRKRHADEPF
ncbi:MAG: hypothetical protein ACOX6E_08610 [Syntrophomonadaceae bacterium]|jgi:hypothetical protein